MDDKIKNTMKAYYQLSTPDSVEAELTLKGTVKDFKALLEVIDRHPSPNYWPQGSLRNAIVKVIRDATSKFELDAPTDATP